MTPLPTRRTLSYWYAALVVATWVLLVVGASVRVNGAGLACPDWPLCFGEVIPPLDVKVGFEFGHRVLAGGIGLAFAALAWLTLRRPDARARLGWLVGLAGVALAVQVVLGGLTVLHLLAEWSVTAHLVVGNTFCLLLLLVALALREWAAPLERVALPWWARGLGVALGASVLAQLVVGGLVSSSHSGMACGPMFPGCAYPAWFSSFPVGIQMVHRLVAYTVLGVAVAAAVGIRSRASLWALAAVLVQTGLGIANVLWQLPVEVTLAHTAGAAAIVLATTWLNHEVWRAPVASISPVRAPRPAEAR